MESGTIDTHQQSDIDNLTLSENLLIVGLDNFPSPFIVDRLNLNIEKSSSQPEILIVVPNLYTPDRQIITKINDIDITRLNTVILFSSTDIYNLTTADLADESSPTAPTSPWIEIEEGVTQITENKDNVRLIILRLPLVVGTGMKGILAEMAAGIMGGTYRHLLPEHDEARHSVIHASDLAEFLPTLIESDARGVYHITDGYHPTTRELAEALAWRIDHKRIYSVPLKWQKLLKRFAKMISWEAYSPQRLNFLSSNFTFSDSRLRDTFPSFSPHSVIDYLKKHDYDNDRI